MKKTKTTNSKQINKDSKTKTPFINISIIEPQCIEYREVNPVTGKVIMWKMKKRRHQHVIPYGSRWAVYGEGNKRKTVITNTLLEAVQKAGKIAINKRSKLIFYDHLGNRIDKNVHPHPNHLDYRYRWEI